MTRALLRPSFGRTAHTVCSQPPRDTADATVHEDHALTVDGACLEVLDFGGRGPVLLFLPGYGNTAHIFDDLAPAFIDRYHVVALTPRGFPPSSAPESGYTIQQLATDVAVVLDSLGARTVTLAGHSIGGAVITEFGMRYRGRLSRAIYLDASFDFATAYRRSHSPGKVLPSDTTSAPFRAWRTRYADWTQGASIASTVDGSYWDRLDSADVARRQMLVAPLAAEVRSHPHQPWRIRVPALALCAVGMYDRAFGWLTPDSARWGAAAVYFDRGARAKVKECNALKQNPAAAVILLDSGHYVFFDQRALVISAMRHFLDSHLRATHR
ncbi:MAG: alpha/beta fold hydrolase [Gemmatimonadaceae bacterium]